MGDSCRRTQAPSQEVTDNPTHKAVSDCGHLGAEFSYPRTLSTNVRCPSAGREGRPRSCVMAVGGAGAGLRPYRLYRVGCNAACLKGLLGGGLCRNSHRGLAGGAEAPGRWQR